MSKLFSFHPVITLASQAFYAIFHQIIFAQRWPVHPCFSGFDPPLSKPSSYQSHINALGRRISRFFGDPPLRESSSTHSPGPINIRSRAKPGTPPFLHQGSLWRNLDFWSRSWYQPHGYTPKKSVSVLEFDPEGLFAGDWSPVYVARPHLRRAGPAGPILYTPESQCNGRG